MTAIPDPAAFILANTRLQSVPHAPDISLWLADKVTPLWRLTEEELGGLGLPPPFWAFAWAGGQGLARWLLDHPEESDMPPGLLTGLGDPALARVLVALHERPGDAWTLERMAREAGLSRSAFSERFKAVVDATPADYLAHWRLAIAQAELRRGASVKAIADTLGYANASALSRVFAQKIGMSPREWLAGAG